MTKKQRIGTDQPAGDPTPNRIQAYMHCKRCLAELPPDESPQSYARLQAGWTPEGWQLWCVRHNMNVIAIDLLGQKVELSHGAPAS